MNIFKGCLIACDVDGTLLYDGKICERNIEKIRYFQSEGGIFSLATGRSAGDVKDVLSVLPDISPSVMANGCMIYDYKNDKILFEFRLKDDERFIAKKVLENFPTVGIEIHSGKHIFTLNRNFETDDHQNYGKLEIIDVDFDTATKYNWNKVLYAPENDEDFKELIKFLASYNQIANFCFTKVFFGDRERHYYEQIPYGLSKQSGIKKLREIMDIKNGCSYAIGDFYNDLEMITSADIGATLDTSPDDIKQMADVVVGNVENGAVADFIEYLIYLRKGK